MTESQQPQGNDPAKPGIPFKNAGEPIKLSGLQLNGVTAEAAREGEPIKIWTRLYLTSDDRFFHYAVESLSGHLEYVARKSGRPVNLKTAGTVLLVVHPDDTGDLWLDAAAVAHEILTKR